MFDITDFPLTYDVGALVPYMSVETMNFHYGKHMAGYVANLNRLISGTAMEHMGLVDIMLAAAGTRAAATKGVSAAGKAAAAEATVAGKPQDSAIFNNAAQVYNHDLFFAELRRDAANSVPAEVAATFGSEAAFLEQFKAAAMAVFGSGWVWLSVDEKGKIKLETTANADNPLLHGRQPILTLDVWEHAYYLDYQNRRAEFVDNFLSHLVDWDVVRKRMKMKE